MTNKIAIISYNWPSIGGSQKRAEFLTDNFKKTHDIDHILINSYFKFNFFSLNNFVRNLKNLIKYRQKLSEYKVVIAFSQLPSIFSLLSSAKLITVITGSSFYYKEAKLISKIYWNLILEPLIYLSAKKIIPAAPHLIPFYVKRTYLNSKVNYINGFIDLEQLKRNTSSKYTDECKFSKINLDNYICLSSSIISHKGIKEFCEIFFEYKKRFGYGHLKLIIIGDGPLLKYCLQFCKKNKLLYQLKDNYIKKNIDVLFTGHLDNPLKIIKKCKLFVMPSFYEGLSNQLLEAIYSGVPIIASNCPGNQFVYSEILKEHPEYINSHFLKLMPVIKNKKIKSFWVKELAFFSKTFKKGRYKNSNKLINIFSTDNNFPKWKLMVDEILN